MILGHSMGAAIALQTFGYVDGWQLGEGGTVLNNYHNRKATYFKMHLLFLLLNILIFQPAMWCWTGGEKEFAGWPGDGFLLSNAGFTRLVKFALQTEMAVEIPLFL